MTKPRNGASRDPEPIAELKRQLAASVAITTSLGDAVLTITAEGGINFVNPAAERTLGYAAYELLGRHVHATIHYQRPDGAPYPEEECPFLTVLETGAVLHRDDECFIRKDGTSFPVEVTVAPIMQDGVVMGAAFVFREISDRRLAEAALAAERNRQASILNAALDAILVSDHEGHIIEFNRAAERIFGYTREQVLGRQMAELIIPERLRSAHHAGMHRHVETGHGHHTDKRLEMPALRADGTEFVAELIISKIPGSTPPMFTGFVRDITERVARQKELREAYITLEQKVAERTAKLRETVAELEAFSYSIAHDIRAPLRAVQGYAEILLEEKTQQLDKEGIAYVERMARAVGRLQSLINDILSYSTLAQGELPLSAINLDKLVQDVLAQYPSFQSASAEIRVSRPLASVCAHEAALTQVLSNLIGNALKFVPESVKPSVHIWTEERTNDVRIWIEDNGIGIPEKDHERIFSIFTRLHSDQSFGGTGIGLSIVKKATERMGGRVGVRSKPGEGSRFWVELPKVGCVED